MLRVNLQHAAPGLVLALPLYNPNAATRLLLERGHVLTEADVPRLAALGVRSLWVAYPDPAAAVAGLHDKQLHVNRPTLDRLTAAMRGALGQTCAKLDLTPFVAAVGSVLTRVATQPEPAEWLTELARDDEQLRHAAAVAVLSLLLGLRLEGYLVKARKHVDARRAADVVNLGLGALFHDLGLERLDPQTLKRWRQSGDGTEPAYHAYPALGFEAVRGHLDPSATTVVLHHHQRFDGSGFAGPDHPAQRGEDIHVYARIAAVADQFDRLRHPPGLPEQPAAFALQAMLQPALRRRFDPAVVDALLDVVPPYPPGASLMLSDGRVAEAIDHHPADPCRPVVQVIGGAPMDLAEHPSLRVEACNGLGTGDYNFTAALCEEASG